MPYTIEYTYVTGDSYNSYEKIGVLEVEWETVELAKANLQRIKEHYKWYKFCCENMRDLSLGRIDVTDEDFVPIPFWHFAKSMSYKEIAKKIAYYSINLKLDNGNEFQFNCPWTGYFERLIGAKVITVGDTDMEFTVDQY